MAQEQATKIVAGLEAIARHEGEAAALKMVDDWVTTLTEITGQEHTDLKVAAYNFVKSVNKQSTIDLILQGLENLVKHNGVQAGLDLMDEWIAGLDKSEAEKAELKKAADVYIRSVVE